MNRCSNSCIIKAPRAFLVSGPQLPLAALGPMACVVLILVAVGGCGPAKFKQVATENEFDEEVLKADKPVVVDFFTGGCASCMFLDGTMDELCTEYDGRVKFVKIELMRFWLEVSCPEIQKRYRIGLYPTVVLFVNGQEKKRWVAQYSTDKYRTRLNEVAPAKPAGTPESTPATPPAAPPETKIPPPGSPAGDRVCAIVW